jgi:hypothetical protein
MHFSGRACLLAKKRGHLSIKIENFNQNSTVILFDFVEGLNW